MKTMEKNEFLKLLKELGKRLENKRKTYDIILFGGLAIMLYYKGERLHTRDADIAYKQYEEDEDNNELMSIVNDMTKEYNLDNSWFNSDGSTHMTKEIIDTITCVDQFGGLHIFVPSAKALLAMKVLASRPKIHSSDPQDIKHLLKITGLKSNANELISLAKSYLPDEMRVLFTNKKQAQLEFILFEINNGTL